MIKKFAKYTYLSAKIIIVLIAIFIIESSTSKTNAKVENENFNRNVDLTTMSLKVNEMAEDDLFTALDTFTGQLTGYAHDCPLCGGTLACAASYNVRDRRDYYPDKEYGTVKIVASSKNLSCGSIIRFNKPSLSSEPIIAIVLDRGVPGNNLDLLVPTEDYAIRNVGRSTVTYDVLRKGW
ncbi:MAG: hypothetical protein K6G37_02550 [Bacilli bacterium]|nr:hypothetical protein [Bacilli bacterium]